MRQKKILAILLSAAMVCTAVPAYAAEAVVMTPSADQAVSADQIDTVSEADISADEYAPEAAGGEDEAQDASAGSDEDFITRAGIKLTPFDPIPEKDLPVLGDSGVEAAGYTFPVSYDSPYQTSVKDQQGSGWCWIYATSAAVESSIMKKYGKTENIFEKQAIWWACHPAASTRLKGLDDYMAFTSHADVDRAAVEQDASSRYQNRYNGKFHNEAELNKSCYNLGGTTLDAGAAVWAGWKAGDVQQSVSGDDENLDAVARGIAADDNKTIAAPQVVVGQYQMKNCYKVPVTNSAALKQLIMDYGGASIGFAVSTAGYSNNGNGAYYQPDATAFNHLVEVVGWDDNYSHTNFANDPGEDGAWIIKNSWGTAASLQALGFRQDQSPVDEKGYNYISYKDYSFSTDQNIAVAYDVSVRGNDDYYDNQYSYDGYQCIPTTYNELTDSSVSYGNIYTASGNEVLKGASDWVRVGQTEYNVKVYKDVSGNCADGTLIYDGNETVALPGYHTFAFDSSKFNPGYDGRLKAGETFSIVFSEVGGGANIPHPYLIPDGEYLLPALTNTMYDMVNNELCYSGHKTLYTSNANRSYYSINGKWSSANVDIMISAFTDDASTQAGTGYSPKFKYPSLSVDAVSADRTDLKKYLEPKPSDTDVLTWHSSNTAVASVDLSGNMAAYVPGTAIITVQTASGNSASITVDVKNSATPLKPVMTAASVSVDYTGAIVYPALTISYNGNLLTEGTDYKVNCDSIHAGSASLTVSGLSAYKGLWNADNVSMNYTINPISMSKAAVTFTTPVQYTGKAIEPVTGVTIDGLELDSSQYKVTYNNNTKPGQATATVTGSDAKDITDSKTIAFYITDAEQTVIAVHQRIDLTDEFDAGKIIKKYSVDNKGRYASINSKGVLTGKKAGTVTVSANYSDGTSDIYKVKVVAPRLAKMYSIVKSGRTVSAANYITDSEELAVSRWTSSNPKVAVINRTTGEIAVQGKAGTSTITAYYGNGTYAARIRSTLRVAAPSFSAKKATVKAGRVRKIRITLRNANPDEAEWSSSNPAMASVSQTSTGCIVTVSSAANKNDTATITALVDNSVSCNCVITAK